MKQIYSPNLTFLLEFPFYFTLMLANARQMHSYVHIHALLSPDIMTLLNVLVSIQKLFQKS